MNNFSYAEGGHNVEVLEYILTRVLSHTEGGHKKFPTFKRRGCKRFYLVLRRRRNTFQNCEFPIM